MPPWRSQGLFHLKSSIDPQMGRIGGNSAIWSGYFCDPLMQMPTSGFIGDPIDDAVSKRLQGLAR